MNEVEEKLVRSFRMVREDVIRLQRKILNMEQREAQIVRILKRIDVNEHELSEKIRKLNSLFKKPATKKVIKITKKTTFVAPKNGKSFHKTNCPFAKNIKPKNSLKFKTKNAALNAGFKPCQCVK
ncbi:hypothetical protein HOF78_01415 [Candidatus Woesearchaeota archaeon]|jgi:hypothetical protein|nr:hypothetical protein [Candidatus Woesearchaeota archaeon]MBT6044957.1 hypothetical protein [Candidatus Woesearchaeota archaeon]